MRRKAPPRHADPLFPPPGASDAAGTTARALARLVYPALTGSTRRGAEWVARVREWIDSALPEGPVTFLLGDVEGSTRMWERFPNATAAAMELRDEITSEVVGLHGGLLPREQGEGDSFFAVFEHPGQGVAAAVDLGRAFRAEGWPPGAELSVRMALHTGEAQLRRGNYYGVEVNRCARIRALAHGGQILASGATASSVTRSPGGETGLVFLGLCRLKDLSRPEEIYQVTDPGLPAAFPALRCEEAVVGAASNGAAPAPGRAAG